MLIKKENGNNFDTARYNGKWYLKILKGDEDGNTVIPPFQDGEGNPIAPGDILFNEKSAIGSFRLTVDVEDSISDSNNGVFLAIDTAPYIVVAVEKEYDEEFDLLAYDDRLYLKILAGDSGTPSAYKDRQGNAIPAGEVEVTSRRADGALSIGISMSSTISDDKGNVFAEIVLA